MDPFQISWPKVFVTALFFIGAIALAFTHK